MCKEEEEEEERWRRRTRSRKKKRKKRKKKKEEEEKKNKEKINKNSNNKQTKKETIRRKRRKKRRRRRKRTATTTAKATIATTKAVIAAPNRPSSCYCFDSRHSLSSCLHALSRRLFLFKGQPECGHGGGEEPSEVRTLKAGLLWQKWWHPGGGCGGGFCVFLSSHFLVLVWLCVTRDLS